MRSLKFVIICVILFSFTSCALNFTYGKTGKITKPSREPDCDFVVYTTPPKVSYDELGVLNLRDYWSIKGAPKKIETIRKGAQELVCRAGGNAILLWEATSGGAYVKATVIYVHDDQ